MSEYHVGTSDLTGIIYAGKAKKQGSWMEWKDKSDVTNEAINAVMYHMLLKIEPGEDSTAYMNTTRSGKYLRLKLEVADHKPEWLEEDQQDD